MFRKSENVSNRHLKPVPNPSSLEQFDEFLSFLNVTHPFKKLIMSHTYVLHNNRNTFHYIY